MDQTYRKLINYIKDSGRRIAKRAGNIADIGVTKQYLTEEDINIERGIKDIVRNTHPDHEFFAEEENFSFHNAKDYWVCDPISGTRTFINGLAHYGMAVAHVHEGKVVFSVVYDPSVDQIYTAFIGKGAFINGERIFVKGGGVDPIKVIFHLSIIWPDKNSAQEMFKKLTNFELYRTWSSQAVGYCHLAKGIYRGLVVFGKDSFPDFAGSLIVKEAGGIVTNISGDENLKPSDRIFVAGEPETYKKLMLIAQNIFENNRTINHK